MNNGVLSVSYLPKPWGRNDLPDPHGAQCEAIGEIWFDTPPPMKALRAKYLFTEEMLSVQVHPTAANSPSGIGKDECWLVTKASQNATLAIGFRQIHTSDEIRNAALDGSITHLLDWRRVEENDFFYLPAGTVHAIGPGLTLVEVQQNTDITYRLYDYGRSRGLHLDPALRSIIAGPHPENLCQKLSPTSESVLVEGPHFRLAHCRGQPSAQLAGRFDGAVQVLPLKGYCRVGASVIFPGGAGWSANLDTIGFANCERSLLFAAA